MKSTENFKKVIKEHLNQVATNDPLFAETLKKEDKNIDDCVQYIINQVEKSGNNAFTDDEVFGMAVHYYDESGIDIGKPISNVKVVSSHTAELSPEEIEEAKALAKKEAIDKVIADEKEKMLKKTAKKKVEAPEVQQIGLF